MITWQNATEGSTEIETGDYVTINGVNYPVKTKLTSSTPLSAENMNTNQQALMDFEQENDGGYIPTDNKQISMNGIKDLNTKLGTMTECITIGLSNNLNSTSAETIKFDTTIFSNTDKLTLNSYGVKIGAGVDTVLVSANIFTQRNNQIGGYIWTQIRQNSTIKSIAIASVYGDYGSSTHTEIPLTVSEGDIITVYKVVTYDMTFRGAQNTYLTVKILD